MAVGGAVRQFDGTGRVWGFLLVQFLLEQRRFVVLCQFVLYSKVSPLYTYPLFFRFYFHTSHYTVLNIKFPVLFSKFFLVTQSIYIYFILYKVVCICQFQSPNLSLFSLSMLVTMGLFPSSVTQLLSCKQLHLYQFFGFHINDII